MTHARSAEHWRLILDGPEVGSWNMAVDEVLLQSAADRGAPSLRFYGWSRPTLSLGYFQGVAERTTHGASRCCDVVRRASGGGAIVHDHELTYSLAVPVSDRWSADAHGLYQRVHRGLIAALAHWGVIATLRGVETPSPESAPFLCFLRHTPTDVICDGVKIAGSAQRRAKGAVLQHGSVLLAKSQYAPELPGIRELTRQIIHRADLAQRWSTVLLERLGIQLEEETLTSDERNRARQIAQMRFGQTIWTNRR